ncbi:MAG: thiamine phosphate synthase, partial [Casimicrobiaceae bacterium]
MHAAATDTQPAPQVRSRLRGLYAVTPDLADTDALAARVRAAIDGGAAAVQYRNKTADPALRAIQAQALADACRGRALFIVNDDAALAARVGADGVHVGEHDGGVAAARAIVGARLIVGVSCYDDLALARAAVAAGADYIAFGSFFGSRVKPDARRAHVSLLRDARAFGVPVVAIGGIIASNAGTLVAAGADMLAVISGVFAADAPADVTRAARALARLFVPPGT